QGRSIIVAGGLSGQEEAHAHRPQEGSAIMGNEVGGVAFTPTVKALQEKLGSRKAYASLEASEHHNNELGPEESGFIAERDSFYMASVSATAWPYVHNRGGPAGFVKVFDSKTLGFADFRGNRQYVSVGNFI